VKLLSFLSLEDPSYLLFQAQAMHIYCFRLPPRHSCHCVTGYLLVFMCEEGKEGQEERELEEGNKRSEGVCLPCMG
jgi:hypothetical protein